MKISLILTTLLFTLGLGQLAYANHDGKGGMHCDRKQMMQEADTNKDGAVSRDEFMANHQKMADKMFTKMDANNDGKIEEAERKVAHEKMGKNCKMKDHKMDDRGNMPDHQ